MNLRLSRLLVRLYPHAWKERYGEELEQLLQSGSVGFRAVLNVLWAALCEHILPTKLGLVMNPYPNSVLALSKLPSAFLPIAMSLIALAVVLGTIALFGVVHDSDEGAAAHIWQLMMAGQAPLLAFFAIKWLPRKPRQALSVFALQIVAALAAMAPVYFLHL
ncbi:MAG: hypothetical protein ACREPT_10965 [Rudaea sp.]